MLALGADSARVAADDDQWQGRPRGARCNSDQVRGQAYGGKHVAVVGRPGGETAGDLAEAAESAQCRPGRRFLRSGRSLPAGHPDVCRDREDDGPQGPVVGADSEPDRGGAWPTYLRGRPEEDGPCLVPIREHGSLPPLFIAHGLGSNLLLFRELAEELGGDQPVYGIQLAAPADATLDELNLEAIAARIVEEICAVDPVGPYRSGGAFPGRLAGLRDRLAIAPTGKRNRFVGASGLRNFRRPCGTRMGHGSTPVSLKATWLRWRKKFSRLFENGIVNTTWRKILYNQLMFKIWLLRQTYREGNYRPQLFGLDPYIALFAERYQPQPIDADGVLVCRRRRDGAESAGLGWSRLLRGRLSVQKIPGSHQTRSSIRRMCRCWRANWRGPASRSRPRAGRHRREGTTPRQPMIST